jgi:hypothetical protein
MVEVPLLPGAGEEIVIAVAESVMPGLLTVAVVVPIEVALMVSPPYVAVIVSVPATKPSDAVALTVSDAVAVLPGAIVTCWTVPIVFPPVVNVSGPVSVPAVPVPVTVAARVTLLPRGKVEGVMVTAVVVAAVPWATTLIV